MSEIYARTLALYGEEGFAKLKEKHVAVFGLGGVGSYAVESLLRSGIRKITVIDSDKYSQSNINRQLYATSKTVGRLKTSVVKERAQEINADILVNAYDLYVDGETINQIDFKGFDYVIDAIDFLPGKIAIVKKCKELGIKVISSMGTGNKVSPTSFKVEDIFKTKVCPLAKTMRKLCREEGVESLKVLYSEEEPKNTALNENGKRVPSSNSFVPGIAGLILAGTVINELIGE